MSWSHNASPWVYNGLLLVSDPCFTPASVRAAWSFPIGRSPFQDYGSDSMRESVIEMLDQSLWSNRLGAPLRNLELSVAPYLSRDELLSWRQLTESRHFVALHPLYYGAVETQVHHFEESLMPEVKVPTVSDPTFGDGTATATPTYVAGACGRALYFDQTRAMYLTNSVRYPQKGYVSFWFRAPADGCMLNRALFEVCANAGGDPLVIRHSASDGLLARWSATAGHYVRFLSGGSPKATYAANEWNHAALSWDFSTTSGLKCWLNGVAGDSSAAVVTNPALLGTLLRVGRTTSFGDACGCVVDDLLYDPCNTLSDASASALYERLASPAQRALQEQTQGHYFRIASDPFQMRGRASTEIHRFAGRVTLQGAWRDPLQACAQVSDS